MQDPPKKALGERSSTWRKNCKRLKRGKFLQKATQTLFRRREKGGLKKEAELSVALGIL